MAKYCEAQVARATTGTLTLRRVVGDEEPPSEVVPLVVNQPHSSCIAGTIGHNLPSSNAEGGSRSGVRARRSKSGVADGGARRDRGSELDNGHIAIEGVLVEARVRLDGRDADEGSTRAPVLRSYQFLFMFVEL